MEARARGARAWHVVGSRVDSLFHSFSQREADRGHLRIGEHHSRRDRCFTDGSGIFAFDRGGGDAGLVLAHVGQQGASVDVADGKQPRHVFHPQPVIHLDRLAGL